MKQTPIGSESFFMNKLKDPKSHQIQIKLNKYLKK